MEKVNFKKLGLLSALNTLSEEIMKLEDYINDEVGIERFDEVVTSLELIKMEVDRNE